MRPLKDIFFIRANADDAGKVKLGNIEIQIDTDFNKYHHSVQCGEIAYCPMKISNEFIVDFELKPGDKIYFHHFTVAPGNEYIVNGEKLYKCHYRDMYCVVRDGKIIPVQDYVFLTPIKESEENFKSKSGLWLKPEAANIPMEGKVEFSCKSAESQGIEIGHRVRYLKDSDYDLKVEGQMYYIMRAKRIIALV